MDFRDILKSFDNLSEGEKTTSDKGTVHKAGPGEYGNKHGSEDVKDQYGKPIGRMSLGKMGLANEPKRGKGRPPNPDKAKSYDSSALSKAMGMGKAPKPTGKPSVKHSLKEYFDLMDEALQEAALAVQPMPSTPQQKQQQQMAGKPSFMIKDPANPNMPAITTQDPAVVQAAKNGTMSMQKPGAAPTAPGAKPATGAGSQVAPMGEDQPTRLVPDTAKIKTGLDNLKGAMQMPGGQSIDSTKLSSTLAGTKSGQSFDASAQREIQKLLPGITAALSNPNTAGLIKQAIATAQKQQSQQGQLDEISPELAATVAARRANQVDQMAHGEEDPLGNSQISTANDRADKTMDQAVKRGATNNIVANALNKVQNGPPVPLRSGGQTTPTPQGFKNPQQQMEDDANWIKGAIKHPGAFTKKASSHGMTPSQFRDKVLAHKEDYPAKTEKQAQLAKTLSKMHEAENPSTFATASPLGSSNNRSDMAFEGKKGVNPFAKKDTKKKPDADKDGVPDWADKKPGKDDNEGKKKGAAPKKGVNPFAKKDEKKKVKEGMEHHLQAARLEGKSHALRKMPYNCTHDDMEEARCYHDGFKEGLDECYGQMPILGRTAVDEVSPEVGTMASYGADELGEMDKTSYMKQQAIKTPGGTFKAFGQTMHDSNVLDEFAFEAFDSQLKALLESEEKVSEGMTVSISKGQQGAPDSVSVSAQDGEADQLLSIIKSAGMGLFGGNEQNGYGAPQGSAGAHGGISVVDDHDGMMALMKKLSGNGGEMSSGGDYESEEGHGDEGHMHGEEGHSHEGEEDTCNECGMAYESCGCDHNEPIVDEEESRDQMAYNVAEDNPPDNGSANSTNATQGNDAANSALTTADAGADEEEGEVYSSPTTEAEDETGQLDEISQELAVKTLGLRRAHGMDGWGDDDAHRKADATEKRVEKKFGKDAVAAADKITDKELYGDRKMKEETMAESFANLYKKLAFLSEESTEKEDEKAEKAGKKVAKDIEYDEGHKGKDDDKAEEAGKKVKKDIEYDDKKDKKEKKLDEWANEAGKNGTDAAFEADIDFMTKVISGGLNKQKSTGQTTIPVINGQKSRMGVDGLGSPMKESNDLLKDYRKLSGL